jgi:hypothetical protein
MLQHHSVAMQPIQDRRDKRRVPGGLRLHQYANLYFHARNPMMSKRRNEAAGLCILRVSTEVLDLPGCVVTDQNAASNYVRFFSPHQWNKLDFDAIYAMDWRHEDRVAQWRHSSRKGAEVLVPNRIEGRFLTGAYVVDELVRSRLGERGFGLPITVAPVLFFR